MALPSSLQEYQAQLKQRGQEIQQTQQQVQDFNPEIEQTRAQLQFANPTSQARVQGLEIERTNLKQEAIKNVAQAEAEQRQLENQFEQVQQQQQTIDQSNETLDKVFKQIQRKAEGKGGSILDTKEERNLYNKILDENISLRESVEQGQQLRGKALSSGFKNVREFVENEAIRNNLFNTPDLTNERLDAELKAGVRQTKALPTLKDVPILSPPEPPSQPTFLEKTSEFFLGEKGRPTPIATFRDTLGNLAEAEKGFETKYLPTLQNKTDLAFTYLDKGKEKIAEFVSPPTPREETIIRQLENPQLSPYGREYLTKQLEELQRAKQSTPLEFLKGAGTGLALAPIGAVELGVGLLTKPAQTLVKEGKNIASLPSALASNPIGTVGSLVGTSAGFEILGSPFKEIYVKIPSKLEPTIDTIRVARDSITKGDKTLTPVETMTTIETPEIFIKKTTPFRQALELEPNEIITLPSKTFKVKGEFLTDNKNAIGITQLNQLGKNRADFDLNLLRSKKIEKLQELSPIDLYVLRKGQRSNDFILTEKDIQNMARVESLSTPFMRLNLKTGEGFIPSNRDVSFQTGISMSREIPNPVIEINKGDITFTVPANKQVTQDISFIKTSKGVPIRSGKVTRTTGSTTRISSGKEPLFVEIPKEEVVSLGTKKNVNEALNVQEAITPQVNKALGRARNQESSFVRNLGKDQNIFLTKPSNNAFAVQSITQSEKQNQDSVQLIPKVKEAVVFLDTQGTKSKQAFNLLNIQSLQARQGSDEILTIEPITDFLQGTDSLQGQKQDRAFRQDMRQRQAQESQTDFINIQTPVRATEPRFRRRETLRRKDKKPSALFRDTRPTKINNLFIPQIRRFGAFRDLSKAINFKDAFRIAKSKTETTLGASFRLVEARNRKVVKTPTPFGFRPSKRDALVQVQIRGRRLASIPERQEIRSSRRSKSLFFKNRK